MLRCVYSALLLAVAKPACDYVIRLINKNTDARIGDATAEILNQRLSVEDALAAVDECGAPVVAIAGGEPLLHREMPQIVEGILARKKFVYLCTNALLLEKKMELFKPNPYFSWDVHLDGDREMHDKAVSQDGVYDRAIAAIRAWGDDLPCTVTLFIEGEEEIASDSLPALLRTYADELTSDVLVLADSANWAVGTPALTTTLRGTVRAVVTVRTLAHSVHSGMFGGAVPNSLTTLCRLLATLHDDAGSVAVAARRRSTSASFVRLGSGHCSRGLRMTKESEMFGGIGSEATSASSLVENPISAPPRSSIWASNWTPRRNRALSSGTRGARVVARTALGTSLMSLRVIHRNWSSLAPALTTLSRSAERGFRSALAISRPWRG